MTASPRSGAPGRPGAAARSLEGRAALVTGGSRGIGLAIGRALVEAGARVALLARDGEALARAAGELGEAAIPVRADVSDPASLRAAFAGALARLGRLDALVNNAALARPAALEEASEAELRAQVDTNLLGVVYATRAAIPALRAAGGGDIVNISSDSAADPFPLLALYAATKGALEVLSAALRRELRPDRIRVTLVRCGPCLTEFARDWDPERARRAFALWREGGWLDPRRVMEPRAVAESVLHALTRPPGHEVETLDLRPA